MKLWLCLPLLILHVIISIYAKTSRHKKQEELYDDALENDNMDYMNERMVNGSTAKKGYFPWTAALLCPKFDTAILDLVYPGGDKSFKIQSCGASILTPKFLITAAHCFYIPAIGSPHRPFCIQYWYCEPLFKYSASQLQVVVGILNTSTLETHPRHNVAKIYSHPDYNIQTLANDVGLIQLFDDQLIEFTNNIYGIGIWNKFVSEGVDAIIAGWGANCWQNLTNPKLQQQEKNRIHDLKYIKVQTAKYSNCNEHYMNYDKTPNNTICAGAKNKNVGQGDSGGGLYITIENGTNLLIGVVSTIITCGNTDPGMVYSVFTRLSTFRNWVYGTMNGRINNKNIKNNKVPQSIDIFDLVQNLKGVSPANNKNNNHKNNNIKSDKNNNENVINSSKNTNKKNIVPQSFNLMQMVENLSGVSVLGNNNDKNSNIPKNNIAINSIDIGKMMPNFPNAFPQNIFSQNIKFPFNVFFKKMKRSARLPNLNPKKSLS